MKEEVFIKLSEFITIAFGMVVALAWSEAIKSLFTAGGPLYIIAAYGVWAYALGISLIAIFATIILGKIKGKYFKSSNSE